MNLSFLLAPLGAIFGLVATLRGKCFDWGILKERSFPIPLICVGNLAVGGTGKTPHVELILRLLHQHGYAVGMLSRGYGRKTRGFLLAEDHHTARDIGDEPYQVKCNCPYATVAVCEKRVIGVEKLMQLRPELDVIVLDDAFQHRYVKPGLNILLTDANRLYVNDHFLPWGRLREGAKAARRAQVVVVTKCDGIRRPPLQVENAQQLYYSHIAYAPLQPFVSFAVEENSSAPAVVAGRNVMLITGIANPKPLQMHLIGIGASHVKVLAFPDHHVFTETDINRMNQTFASLPDALAITTQKDATRLSLLRSSLAPGLLSSLWVQPIMVEVSPSNHSTTSFNQIIIDYVSKNSRNRCVD